MLSSFGLSCSRLNALRLCTRPLIYFFLSFSKIFILAYYRDLKRIFRSPRSVIVDHCRSFLVLVTTLVWLPYHSVRRQMVFWTWLEEMFQRHASLLNVFCGVAMIEVCLWSKKSAIRWVFGPHPPLNRQGPDRRLFFCAAFTSYYEVSDRGQTITQGHPTAIFGKISVRKTI